MTSGGENGATAEILRRLSNSEKKVESLDETSAFAMRSSRDKHQEALGEIFGKSRRRAQVYLAANGKRSVNEIAHLLEMKPPNVSIELGRVEKGGLLGVTSAGGANYWNKKPIDSSLGISDLLVAKWNLNSDGTRKR